MKWLAIVNPTAHNGASLSQLRSIARMLHHELDAPCAWTRYPRHARDIAQNSREFEGLIAVGGDGTIYEIVNGMDRKSQCLAIIPAGTGNGLARELHVPNVSSAFQQLRRPRLASLDLIQLRFHAGRDWQQRYVVHNAAVGYFAEVVALALGPLKPFGYLRYAAAACLQCCRQKPFRARMRIDDSAEQELPLTNLNVNNTRYAGTFYLFPQASLQDGRLDLLYGNHGLCRQFIEDLGVVSRLFLVQRSLRAQAQKLNVELSPSLTLTIDGELIPQVDALQFQVERGCLRFVAGKGSGLKLLDEELVHSLSRGIGERAGVCPQL